MKLSELLQGVDAEALPASRSKLAITGIAVDSRTVKAGDVFFALDGARAHGASFVTDAVAKGAVAIVAGRAIDGLTVPVVKVANARRALAVAASNFYGKPAAELSIIGITGTNGKTTTAWLVESICAAGMSSVGMFGTIATRFAGHERIGPNTTPEPTVLHATLREMVDLGVDTVVMEVSSHALAQERVAGLTMRAAGFTNLSRDHLDYHSDVEAYFQAKRRLFIENLSPTGLAVVNADDTYTNRIYNEMRQLKRQAWRFSRTGAGELSVANIEMTADRTKGTLKTPAGDIAFTSALVGAHNLENILCAAGLGLAVGASRRDVQEGIERVTHVRGRMERVVGKGIVALVDYAHTPDALQRVLESARGFTKGRLLVVFGCGGDRDIGKRPLMGEVAAAADVPIVTSDNARSESPEAIIEQVVPGLEKAGLRRMGPTKAKTGERGYLLEADRALAIQLAISLAKAGDTILIAGKGHEQYQEIAGERLPFDDVDVARKALLA